MPSEFGWLDHDDSQRRRMLAAIELFKEDGTVDELGIGAVRDTIAGVLFPGTSVLHTRARYLLFVPWCVMQAGAAKQRTSATLRPVELDLIDALIAGGDHDGLIGRDARRKLKRLPSAQYWAVLGRWGIRRANMTIEGYFRESATFASASARQPGSEDDEPRQTYNAIAFDADLPKPPANWLEAADFELTPEESGYLGDRWRMTARNSLLPWLLDVGLADAAYVWEHPGLASAPAHLQMLVELGRRFSELMRGAALLYNLQLAEAYDSVDERGLEEHYRESLTAWHEDVRATGTLMRWNRDEFWTTVRTHNASLKRATEVFCEAWIEGCQRPGAIADDGSARQLVAQREIALKGGRARLHNPAALAAWKGASGLVPLGYNWPVAARLAADILANPAATSAGAA